MVELKTYYGNEMHLQQILDAFPTDIINVDLTNQKISDYYYGTKYITGDTKKIYYLSQENDNKTAFTIALILPEYILNYLFNCAPACNGFTQVRFMIDNKVTEVERSYSGRYFYNKLRKHLLKYYTNQEIDDILHSYDTVLYDKDLKQFHYDFNHISINTNTIYLLDNCYKFDINGAHQDALTEMFPKAKPLFDKLEKQKQKAKLNKDVKTKNMIKGLFNQTVGYFKHAGFVGAYNWIVQRTTKILLAAIKFCDGELLYANTDGFLIRNPKNILNTSNKLGEFKKEYTGKVYFYSDINYYVFQCGKEICGNSLLQIRQNIDLSKGKVIHYKKEQEKLEYELKTGLKGAFKATNIRQETINIKEI